MDPGNISYKATPNSTNVHRSTLSYEKNQRTGAREFEHKHSRESVLTKFYILSARLDIVKVIYVIHATVQCLQMAALNDFLNGPSSRNCLLNMFLS